MRGPKWHQLALICATALVVPPRAFADTQWSARLGAGGGARTAPDAQQEALFELHVRSEVLFGPGEPDVFRAGPALDLRTADFETAEAAAGAALLVPIASAFPLVLTGGVGWASRPGDADGAFGLATLAWGLRSYNYQAWYGYALQLYASARAGLEGGGDRDVEITAGVEIDLLFLVVIPALFIGQWAFGGGDPDEPESAQ